jgi:hypothetical protein
MAANMAQAEALFQPKPQIKTQTGRCFSGSWADLESKASV